MDYTISQDMEYFSTILIGPSMSGKTEYVGTESSCNTPNDAVLDEKKALIMFIKFQYLRNNLQEKTTV